MSLWERIKETVWPAASTLGTSPEEIALACAEKPRTPERPVMKRYAAARVDRLSSGWTVQNLSSDAVLRFQLQALRARSRQLAEDNDYAKKFLDMVVGNVAGPNGIKMQMKAKNPDGNPDKWANQIIETAWASWSQKGVCDVTGSLSWRDAQRLFIRTVAMDGECLVRKVRGFDNAYGFAIQFMEADYLSELLQQDLGSRGEVRMGVEMDSWGRPTAYHLFQKNPTDYPYGQTVTSYERISANDIIHGFIKLRPSQSRGVPWMHSAMTRLNMLGGYEEAEVVAARVAASKMGFFTSSSGDEYVGDDVDDNGNIITEAEPGIFEKLPHGFDFKEFNPQHPVGNFGPFMKTALRGIASGLNVSYNSLASDLESVNYSSIRAGTLDERDYWQMLQGWMIDAFCQPIFADWLYQQIATNKLNLPLAKFDKFNAAKWLPRGWKWVDPLKDIEANILGIRSGIQTRADTVGQGGEDLEEIFSQLKAEEDLAKKYGLEFDTSVKGTALADSKPGNTPAINNPQD